jgi:hypothetical protein
MTPSAFAQKWKGSQATEMAASQEQIIDPCRLLGEPTPNEADPTGEHYAFEKRVTRGGGGDGFANFWKRGFSALGVHGTRRVYRGGSPRTVRHRDGFLAVGAACTGPHVGAPKLTDEGWPDGRLGR